MRGLIIAAAIFLGARAQALQAFTRVTPPPWLQAFDGAKFKYFRVQNVESYKVGSVVPHNHPVDLFVGVDAGSSWSPGGQITAQVVTELTKTVGILALCGFGFGNVNVLYFNYTAAGRAKVAGYASSSPYDPPFEFALYQELPARLRPMIILNQVGYAEAFNANAVSRMVSIYGNQLINISNLSFLPYDTAVDYNARLYTQASFSLMAHEIAHVVGNLEHVRLSAPNLMNDGVGTTLQDAGHAMSGALNNSQCTALLKYVQPSL